MPTEIVPQSKKVSDALARVLDKARSKGVSIRRDLFNFEMLREFGASQRTVDNVLEKFELARIIDVDDEFIHPMPESDHQLYTPERTE